MMAIQCNKINREDNKLKLKSLRDELQLKYKFSKLTELVK